MPAATAEQPAAAAAADDCGCQARKERLNQAVPGLGDQVAAAADPIYERWQTMPEMLRPDMKSVVWLLIGAIVVPMVIKRF